MPTKLLHDTDSEVESFVVNKDHYHALQNPSDDEAGRTPPGALEWLFDSAVEQMNGLPNKTLHETAKQVSFKYFISLYSDSFPFAKCRPNSRALLGPVRACIAIDKIISLGPGVCGDYKAYQLVEHAGIWQ